MNEEIKYQLIRRAFNEPSLRTDVLNVLLGCSDKRAEALTLSSTERAESGLRLLNRLAQPETKVRVDSDTLFSGLVRIAYEDATLRSDILPVLRQNLRSK